MSGCRILEFDGFQVYEMQTDLAPGSLQSCRSKFALSGQHAALEEIVRELEDGSLYRGDAAKGEIEIVGIARIVSNRFWSEVEYNVLFPGNSGATPSPGTYRAIRWNAGVEPGTAALCLTTDCRIVLSKGFRHAARAWRLSIPRGLRKPGETLEECGFREALEESGVCRSDRTEVFDLGPYEPDDGLAMQRPSLVMYTNVTVDPEKIRPDRTESVSGHLALPIGKVLEMIGKAEILDGFTQAAVLRALVRKLI